MSTVVTVLMYVAQPWQFRVINIMDPQKICVLNTVGAVVCDHPDVRDVSRSNLERGNFDF